MIKKFRKLGPFRLPAMLSNGKVEEFKIFFYRFDSQPFYVLVKGSIESKEKVLVRVHSACSFAHVFHSQRCDCWEQLEKAMELIAEKNGILIYIWNHEGRAVGFENHFKAYMKQDEGFDTVDSYIELGLPVDKRDYSLCAEILKDLKAENISLLTNNPRKIKGLESQGIKVERVPLTVKLSKFNESQIKVKKEKLGHLYELKELK
ncbi:GTP cyclohydrolase II [Candidatus Micrarchaeota archaeon]|nr:GTP cyclohydrolase II [Candidatus Micrarchaeota archaeon]MBU2477171.1 GTP cyclohydrolase II [Candidatus Micrarchaeota archaeon]